jgi:hypothetical protein
MARADLQSKAEPYRRARWGFLGASFGGTTANPGETDRVLSFQAGVEGGFTVFRDGARLYTLGAYLFNVTANHLVSAEGFSRGGAELGVRRLWQDLYASARIGVAKRSISVGIDTTLYKDVASALDLGACAGYELPISDSFLVMAEAGVFLTGPMYFNAEARGRALGAEALFGVRYVF